MLKYVIDSKRNDFQQKKTVSGSISYEEERSQLDFDEVVRQNQQKYKGETKLTNEQVLRLKSSDCEKLHLCKVLDNIAREEGEDRPNISQLLAWAKGDTIMCLEKFVLMSYVSQKRQPPKTNSLAQERERPRQRPLSSEQRREKTLSNVPSTSEGWRW